MNDNTKHTSQEVQALRDWFQSMQWKAFPFQVQGWQAYHKGDNGIVNAPTGSGKTYTALNCIKMTYEEENPVVIIGVPYRLLGFQWAEECRNFFNEQDLQYEVVPCCQLNKGDGQIVPFGK